MATDAETGVSPSAGPAQEAGEAKNKFFPRGHMGNTILPILGLKFLAF